MTTEDIPTTSPAPDAHGDEAPENRSAERRRSDWWRDRRVAVGVGYVAIVLTIGWLYGIVPLAGRSFPLAPHASMASWADCLAARLSPCTYIGYPEGVDLSLSATLAYGTWLITRLGVSVEAALNIQSLLALAAGAAALWALACSIARSALAGPVAVALYYASPIVLGLTSKASLWIGLLLLPVPVAVAYAAARSISTSWRVVLACAGPAFVASVMLVYLDPYSWAIAGVAGGVVCLAGGVARARRRDWLGGLVPLLTLLALLVPGVIFRSQEPSAEVSAGFPPEFYRAYGADLATTVVPTQDSLLADLVRWPVEPWDTTEFYGDGSNLTGAFMGVFLIAAAAAGGVWLLRRRRSGRLAVLGLGVAGVVCLVLGLGPSIKLLDRASVPVTADGYATGTDHLMPASEATVSLPWSWVYGIQPFEGMRAAYRWHVGFRLVLAVLAAVAVVWLFRRRRALGVALAGLLLLETASHSLLDAREQRTRDHALVQRFEDDIDLAYGDGRLRPSERVLFLPASNDYLIGMISPRFEVFSYNLAFDKELTRIRAGQPRPVVEAITAWAENTLTRDHVCELFREDLADAVVFNDFDMRWDTLEWPPSEERLATHRNRNEAFGLFDDPAFDVDEGHLSVIVRPAQDSPAPC